MFRYISSILDWLVNLFNPPPLASMSRMQKINRSFLITLALVVNCILLAMLLALGIYLVERGKRILTEMPEEMNALGIIFASICVNTVCVFVLFQVKKADRKLMEKDSDETTDGAGK